MAREVAGVRHWQLPEGIAVKAQRQGQTWWVTVGDQRFALRLVKRDMNFACFQLEDGHLVPVYFHQLAAGSWQLHVQGRCLQVSLTRPAKQGRGQREGTQGEEEVRAPIPGRVVQVLAAAGSLLPPGSPLLVLEAMKMQNLISTQRGGRLREMLVVPGATVEAGQLLAVVGGGE